MVTFEELEKEKKKQLNIYANNVKNIEEKEKIKKMESDIKKIKAANFRAKLGITKKDVDAFGQKTDKVFQGIGKTLAQTGKFMGKFGIALIKTSYEQQDKERRRIKKNVGI